MKRNYRDKGFTLIELMIVVMIMSTLAALIVPRLAGRSDESKRAAARADIDANLSNALDLFELDNGAYPTTEQGLRALAESPSGLSAAASPSSRWKGPYVKKNAFKDPWGNPYQYRSPGTFHQDYDLFSFGPDGAEGGGDDIGNWSADKS